MALNDAMPRLVIDASVPPAMTAVASPRRIHSAPSPMACAPDAHALTTAKFGPFAPVSMATIPAGMSTIIAGTVKGDTRRTPKSCSAMLPRSKTSRPPTPDAMSTPTSSGIAPTSSCASAIASRAAASAMWMQRLLRRASFLPITESASKPLISPAMRVGSADASNSVMGPIPLAPARHARHVLGASSPSGVTAPRPVMATRTVPFRFTSRLRTPCAAAHPASDSRRRRAAPRR